MTRALLAVTLVLAALSSGCEAQPAAKAPRAAAAPAPDLNRSGAIMTARSDVRARYGNDGWIAWVDAQQLGRYWVVELRSHDGKGLRYAISTADGSIRERRLFQ